MHDKTSEDTMTTMRCDRESWKCLEGQRGGEGSSPRFFGHEAIAATTRRRPDACQRGTAVIVMLFLMAILMLLVAGNVRTLVQLKQELRLVERKQIRRLERGAQVGRTNAVPRIVMQPEKSSVQAPSK